MRYANFGIFDTVHSLRYKRSKVRIFRKPWSDLHHLPHCKSYIPCTNRLVGGYSAYHASTHTPLRTESQPTEVMSSYEYSLVSPEGDDHWFKDWYEQRQHKLTASTFAAATGFWRGRRTQLWLEKIGAIRPFMGNAATQWSNAHEKAALERYMWISGHSILLPGFQEFSASNPDEEDWLAASADGIVEHFIYGLPYYGILEIKCPFFAGEPTNSYPWSKVPVHHVPQAQGLMEILDKQWMDFYCWTPNGSSLFRMHRCSLYWNLLKSVLSDFWWNHVQPAREICSMYPIVDPIWELSPLRPAPKHEQFGDIVYKSRLLADDSKLLLKEINGKIVY